MARGASSSPLCRAARTDLDGDVAVVAEDGDLATKTH
jgi:hypothetical protein